VSLPHGPDPDTCAPQEDDYEPGIGGRWAGCSSDSDTWTRFEDSVSTIARIDAMEAMALLLWENPAVPSPEDFLRARELYAADEGLGSRVARREDEHEPPAVDAQGQPARCRDEGIPALNPARCPGPGVMVPAINDAFERGIRGESPRVQAARIEGLLHWFLVLSTHKEAKTCTEVRRDCDSSWAYWSGGSQPADPPRGLARAIDEATDLGWRRTWDAVLAVRCWRENDTAELATNLALRDEILLQMDRGLHFGLARLVSFRMDRWAQADAAGREAAWGAIRWIAEPLAREAGRLGLAPAPVIRAALDGPMPTDEAAARAFLDAITTAFPCP
jgi:hypothetical protein